jgi:hypothetical protein
MSAPRRAARRGDAATMGAFAEWQPRYAEHGVATFPVRGKRPTVKGYLGLSVEASRQLATRYGGAAAFGFALKPASITVVDVDTPDERVLADALDRHGATPIVVRSGSGNWQAWYRHHGEGRRIRAWPDLPIDVLGDGYVVAPASMGAKGPYQIVQGALADLGRLPVMQNAPKPVQQLVASSELAVATAVREGARNKTLWRFCMQQAWYCDDLSAMLDVAQTENTSFMPPLADNEVVEVAKSAWKYHEDGRNWFGIGKRIISTHDEVDGLMHDNPDAFILLTILRRHHWARDFVVANQMADRMPGGGWPRKRLAAARQHLEAAGFIKLMRPASVRNGPAVYRFEGGQK